MTRRLHTHAAERALLGCILVEGSAAYLDAVDLLTDADWHHLGHREIWSAMGRLHSAGKDASDIDLLAGEMGPALEAVGGVSFLGGLAMRGSRANIPHYAEQMRNARFNRAVRTMADDVLTSDLQGEELVLAVIERMSKALASRPSDDRAITIGDAAREAMRQLESAVQTGAIGLPTGIPAIDTTIGGIKRRALMVLAGRPSMGKSALARTFAASAARAGHGVHVFSAEDSATSYALRQIADDAGVDLADLAGAKLKQRDLGPVSRAVADLRSRGHWLVDDSSGISAREIASRVRRRKREIGTALVIVDYVQLLVDPSIPRADKRVQVDVASEDLRKLAADEDVAVVLLSQLSREVERREDKRPMLSDLRESGGLEQIADVVAFCYRQDYYEPKNEAVRGLGELVVRKNKHGRNNLSIDMMFDAPTATYRPLSRREEG